MKRRAGWDHDAWVRNRVTRQLRLWAREHPLREAGATVLHPDVDITAHIVELSSSVTGPTAKYARGFGHYSVLQVYVRRDWLATVRDQRMARQGEYFILEAGPLLPGLPVREAFALRGTSDGFTTEPGFLARNESGFMFHHTLIGALSLVA